MLRSTELNMFSMTNTICRDLVCRANGGTYQLSGKTPLRYDGKVSCMSKQSVTLLLWFLRPAKTMNLYWLNGQPNINLPSIVYSSGFHLAKSWCGS